MAKQPKKKNEDFFQIYGINGSSNIIQAKKINIVRIDIMMGGLAEKKLSIIIPARSKFLPIHHIPKTQFLKQYTGKRTQGIVVTFRGKIIQNIPQLKDSIIAVISK